MSDEIDLGTILQELHDSEINAGVQSFFDRTWTAWLGDPMNGVKIEQHCETAAEAAAWLAAEALVQFPLSDFAKLAA